MRPSNCIFMIEPKRSPAGIWAFTDPAVNLVNEPFVGETNEILDFYAEGKSEMTLLFSAVPFPSHQIMFEKVPDGGGLGATYYDAVTKTRGWLCPALFKYFDVAPDYLFVKVVLEKSIAMPTRHIFDQLQLSPL